MGNSPNLFTVTKDKILDAIRAFVNKHLGLVIIGVIVLLVASFKYGYYCGFKVGLSLWKYEKISYTRDVMRRIQFSDATSEPLDRLILECDGYRAYKRHVRERYKEIEEELLKEVEGGELKEVEGGELIRRLNGY